MNLIPSYILRQLYTRGSLKSHPKGFSFEIKNRLSDATFNELVSFKINGQSVPASSIFLELGNTLSPYLELDLSNGLSFPLGRKISIVCEQSVQSNNEYTLEITLKTTPFGLLTISVKDEVSQFHAENGTLKVPRSEINDYSEKAITERWEFVESFTQTNLKHLKSYSFEPERIRGNIEQFSGVIQVPLAFAGPLTVNGQQAKGSFIIPLATTEGTLVASYNRGIKLINLCGGVNCIVSDQGMQRAPLFECESAQKAIELVALIQKHEDSLKYEAEQTSSIAKLISIEPYQTNKFVFCRFNFFTGDASGQNMVSKATLAAANWLLSHVPFIKHFYLESNFAPDKKSSYINVQRTRGRKVTAEMIIKREHLVREMRVEPEQLLHHLSKSSLAVPIAGLNNNALHSTNAITAMFIATGQDVGAVVESASALAYSELTKEGDMYASITLPSLVVATYGGGTGLPTQRECLELMDCYGANKANKLAEIIAGVVMAGEISLAAAISSLDWVASHESLGRNRS